MNLDFHYYGTYCAARIAGYSRADAQQIAYYAQFVDECSERVLKEHQVPEDKLCVTVSTAEAAQRTLRSMSHSEEERMRKDGIRSAFHFLPGNLGERISVAPNMTRQRRELKMLCLPCSPLVVGTVEKAKRAGTLPAVGMAMHILADTWAHCYFAGISVRQINDIRGDVWELREGREVALILTPPGQPGDRGAFYSGHARIGYLPDYSFMKYRYVPAWSDREFLKNNPEDYMLAFCQMVAAMRYIRGILNVFGANTFASLTQMQKKRIGEILEARRCSSEEGWRSFIAEGLSDEDRRAGCIEEFDVERCFEEYAGAKEALEIPLNQFLLAARNHRHYVEESVRNALA